jgi:hypothetical protein
MPFNAKGPRGWSDTLEPRTTRRIELLTFRAELNSIPLVVTSQGVARG